MNQDTDKTTLLYRVARLLSDYEKMREALDGINAYRDSTREQREIARECLSSLQAFDGDKK